MTQELATGEKTSLTSVAAERTAEASVSAVEETAIAANTALEHLLHYVPFLEVWWAKIPIIIVLVLLVFVFKKAVIRLVAKSFSKTKNSWDDSLIEALSRSTTLLILIFGFESIRLILAAEFPYHWLDGAQTLSGVGLILVVTLFITDFIKATQENIVAKRQLENKPLDLSTARAISKLLSLFVYIMAGLVILQVFGVSISGFLAFGGIGGMIFALAAKDLLANFFGAVMVHLDKPFRIGDWVRSPDREIEGTVEDIGWRVTRIRTFDKRPLYVPNSAFTTIAIENPSRMANRRINETIGIRYADIAQVSMIVENIKTMLKSHNDIDQTSTLIVNLNGFSAFSVDVMVYVFTTTTEWSKYHDVKHDILMQIYGVIEQCGAQMAFPTSTLHIEPTTNAFTEGTSSL